MHVDVDARACMLLWERDRVLETTAPVLRGRCRCHLVICGVLRDLDESVRGGQDLGADGGGNSNALANAHYDSPVE